MGENILFQDEQLPHGADTLASMLPQGSLPAVGDFVRERGSTSVIKRMTG
jgi:hypothetical protein